MRGPAGRLTAVIQLSKSMCLGLHMHNAAMLMIKRHCMLFSVTRSACYINHLIGFAFKETAEPLTMNDNALLLGTVTW
jgi:hypothetical protein